MLRLYFTDPATERDAVRDRYDLLLGVVATFFVEVSRRVLYRETLFPIVELRAQLGGWLTSGFVLGERFAFQSLESEDEDLVTFSPASSGGWTVGARHQLRREEVVLPDYVIRDACISYVADVDRWVRDELEIDVDRYL